MATLTLQIDNDTLLNNLTNVLKLMKGVTILPMAGNHKAVAAPRAGDEKAVKDVTGIGGAWASDDFPTYEELRAMRKSNHKIAVL